MTPPARVDSPEALRALPEAELPALAEALRQEIVAVCGRVGGHLGASLGAVELVVAADMALISEPPGATEGAPITTAR